VWGLGFRVQGSKFRVKSHGVGPVHQIIAMIKWILTSRLSTKKSLSGGMRAEGWGFRRHAPGGRCWGVASSSSSFACRKGRGNISGPRILFSRFLPRSSAPGGLNVIRREAWLFCGTSSGVRICWELEEPGGPKGPWYSSCPYDLPSRYEFKIRRYKTIQRSTGNTSPLSRV